MHTIVFELRGYTGGCPPAP